MTRFKISPVFGVIIMVCITVILAAGIAWFALGASGFNQKVPEKVTGMILQKNSIIQEIQIIDEEAKDTKVLTVKDNTLFNSLQQFKRYELSLNGKEVLSVKGPL